MKKCILEVLDEVNVRFKDLGPETRRKCSKACEYFLHKARHMPAFKMGRWDGTVSLFALNGNTFIGALEKVLPIIIADGYDVEIVDNRVRKEFKFEPIDVDYLKTHKPDAVWPKGHMLEGEPIILRDYQVEAINRFLEEQQSIQILSTGAGKEQPISSRIKVPGGWKLMGDMAIGDTVIAPNGKQVQVNGVFPQGVKDVYEFTFVDGRKARAGIEHLWRIYCDWWPYNGEMTETDEWKVINTKEIIEKIELGHQVYVQIAKPELVDKTGLDATEYAQKGIIEDFVYEISPIERVELLSKLPTKTANIEYANSIVELYRSVGGSAIIRQFDNDYTIIGYYPTIVSDEKGERLKFDAGYTRLQITSVELVGTEECQCISVDSKDHLYVTDDWVVTHNTLTSATLSHICEQYGRTIIIVPSKSLVLQTERDYKLLNLDVGVYFGDRKEVGHTHTICTWQSLGVLAGKSLEKYRTNEHDFADMVKDVVCVMVDEAHGGSAASLKNMLSGAFANIPIRWGFTGTIPKEPHLKDTLEYIIGKIVGSVTARELMDKDVLAECDIKLIQMTDYMKFADFQDESHFIATDPARLDWLAAFAMERAKSGNTMILVNKIETGKELAKRIPDCEFISGAVKTKDRKDAYDDIQNGTNKIVVATYGVAAVGIDIGRIFNLFLFEPGKSFVRVIQSIGRGIRKAKDKDSVFVFDISSSMKYSKRHLSERKAYYKEAQYKHETIKVEYLQNQFPEIKSRL